MSNMSPQKATMTFNAWWKVVFLLVLLLLAITLVAMFDKEKKVPFDQVTIVLPAPDIRGTMSLEEAIDKRRSARNFADGALSLKELAQLLWAAQGITSDDGKRAAPSAGALYPLEMHVVAGEIEDLPPGVYRYVPVDHSLVKSADGDKRNALWKSALLQSSVRDGAAALVISAVYARTKAKYGKRGDRYVLMEAGHAAQNIYLQAVALNIGTVAVGAFQDTAVKKVLQLPEKESPLYILPIGRVEGT